MQIPKGNSVAVVVSRDWTQFAGVRLFLKHNEIPPGKEVVNKDRYIIFATVLDADDPKGLWIELKSHKFFVPSAHILAVAISETFPPEIQEAAKKMSATPRRQGEM